MGIVRPPPIHRELDMIKKWLHNSNVDSVIIMEWPIIIKSPINEFNTPCFFNWKFTMLFPTGACDSHEARDKDVFLHEYVKHIIRYRDGRFGHHL